MDVSLEIHCGHCGSANYSIPRGEVAGSDVLCNDCGSRLATVAGLKVELMEQALARSAEGLRRQLDRLREDEAA